jgi:hypothetical protein
MVSVMRGDSEKGFVDWMGVLCSSWVSICRATSQRSYLDPLGNESLQFVASGNKMASRLA